MFNALNGTVPADIGALVCLTWLYVLLRLLRYVTSGPDTNECRAGFSNLGYNELTGTLPASICELARLTQLCVLQRRMDSRHAMFGRDCLQLR